MNYPLLLVALLASTATAAAQSTLATEPAGKPATHKSDGKLPIDPESHMVTYSGVIEVPGATQDQLYTRAASWIAGTATYHVASSKQLLEATDKSQLTVNGETQARGPLAQVVGTVSHSLTIYCKDGRYKYVLTNLREETTDIRPTGTGSGGAFENEKPACGGLHMYTGVWNTIKRHTDEDVQDLVARLKTAMASTSNQVAAQDNPITLRATYPHPN
jgi:hypothetical protein